MPFRASTLHIGEAITATNTASYKQLKAQSQSQITEAVDSLYQGYSNKRDGFDSQSLTEVLYHQTVTFGVYEAGPSFKRRVFSRLI